MQNPFDCVPCTSLYTSTPPISDGRQSAEEEEKKRKERKEGKPRQCVKEEGGRVCCINLDVKKNETTEQDPPRTCPSPDVQEAWTGAP